MTLTVAAGMLRRTATEKMWVAPEPLCRRLVGVLHGISVRQCETR